MKDDINALKSFGQSFFNSDITLNIGYRATFEIRDVTAWTSEYLHVVPMIEQLVNQMTSDKTCSSSDERVHHLKYLVLDE